MSQDFFRIPYRNNEGEIPYFWEVSKLSYIYIVMYKILFL